MSDTKPERIDAEQLQKISGGDCSASDIAIIIGGLTEAYESLIDFTSHVIERVSR